ncbi:MAG: polynucleotide adenylyltransferase PcnB [Arenicellaceae bacterium]|nr:polynucleotide adenylyltransferase PcnB [Arenicellaceae bacterium]
MSEKKLNQQLEKQPVEAKILGASEYSITPDQLSKAANIVINTLQEAGYEAFVVGGCVRDLIVGKRPKDFDVSTDASPEQVCGLFKMARTVGRRFRIAHVKIDREIIEVATFRAAADKDTRVGQMVESTEGMLTRDNVYGTRAEDALRRDFTVNALYYDPVSSLLLDDVGGLDDIEAKFLRSIGPVEQRFREDPVRMLRVIRFSAKLGFEMEPEAMSMIEELGGMLNNVPPARMFDEVLKLFHGGAALATFVLLRKYALFKYLFPFTDHCLDDDEPGLPEKAMANTDKRVNEGKPVIPAFLFACMLWEPVRDDAEKIITSGASANQAWKIAIDDTLRDQCQYVAIPKRLAETIVDIWDLQMRLARRQPVEIKSLMGQRRFRAAYDFLLLRSELSEVDRDIVDWWTEIQEQDAEQQLEMVQTLKQEREEDSDYPDDNIGNRVDGPDRNTSGNTSNNSARQNKNKSRGRGRGRRNTPNSGQANGQRGGQGQQPKGAGQSRRRKRPSGGGPKTASDSNGQHRDGRARVPGKRFGGGRNRKTSDTSSASS